METFFTQMNPKRDIWVTDGDWPKIIAMGPYLDDIDMARNRKATGVLTNQKVFDATTKGNPKVRRVNFETSSPEGVQKWVVENWRRWGLAERPVWNKPYMDMKPAFRL